MKKKKSFFHKICYFLNTIAAFLLLFGYVLPYISPKSIPFFAVISLIIPVLIVLNLAFAIYWLINLKKHFLLSAVILVIGYLISTPFYKISSVKNHFESDLKIMSYNVRMFNYYKHIKEDNIDTKIINFIAKKQPDILAIQECYRPYVDKLDYQYSYFVGTSKSKKFGQAIFSKYKIINKGSLNFQNSSNNSIFVDILYHKDTIRVYNVHLQSLRLNPKKENLGQESSEKLKERLEKGFIQQAEQTQKIVSHEKQFRGKKIICGDFNNTAYSWVYRELSKDKDDAFVKAGKGFGKTYNYFFPMRIDFILTDTSAKVNNFKNYDCNYSDHYPIMTSIHYKDN